MVKKYTYRFKTETEFLKEFGRSWKNLSGWNDEYGMDYLLGTDIDVPHVCLNKKGDVIDRFSIRNITDRRR